MLKPWDIVGELESDNSRLFKESVVAREAQAGNDEFFKGCHWALDSMITFGVRKVAEKSGDGKGIKAEKFWETAEALSNRQLTGNDALTAINFLRMNALEKEWNHWYRRILIKDLRCGVSEKTINNVVGKVNSKYTVPVFSCQLAHDGANHESKVSGNKLVEIKLDGVRVITIVYPDGHVDQYSRNGKELVNFEHVKKQISKHAIFFKEPTVLDGEIMSSSFQDLMKQVHRKDNVAATDAVLHLFDIITLKEFQQSKGNHRQIDRSYSLATWYDHIKDHMPNVSVLGQELINLDTAEGKLRFTEINRQAIENGYEGIMIKDPDAVYECKRTHSWLKQKPFIEVSLSIVDFEEGTGRNVGRLGAIICKGEDDGKVIQVNVGSGFSDSDRDLFWVSRDSYRNRIVEVRADAITRNQDGSYSLRFPRFKGVRGFQPGEKM
jgi:DNA ligase-1